MNSSRVTIPDGLSEIEHALTEVLDVIAQTARWVNPETFRQLPVWCPDTARGSPRFNAAWTARCVSGRGVEKVEENIRAGRSLFEALGVVGPKPKNWTVCHIWGYDDEGFIGRSNVVQDPRYYSCVGNMVWLPTPLKGFTDAVPSINFALRLAAFRQFGWACEHPDVAAEADRVRGSETPSFYPDAWLKVGSAGDLPGTSPYNQVIADRIAKRKNQIRHRLQDDHPLYPRSTVQDVLSFWKIDISN